MRALLLVSLISIGFFGCAPIDIEQGDAFVNPSITGGQRHLQQPFQGLPEPSSRELTQMPLPYPVPEVMAAQKQGAASFNLLNYNPNQLIACTRGRDLVTVTLYFYEPDQDNMICSFLAYSKEYKDKPAVPAAEPQAIAPKQIPLGQDTPVAESAVSFASGSSQQETVPQANAVAKYIESNSHLRGPDYDDCLKRAQEKVDTKQDTGWECSETQLPGSIEL